MVRSAGPGSHHWQPTLLGTCILRYPAPLAATSPGNHPMGLGTRRGRYPFVRSENSEVHGTENAARAVRARGAQTETPPVLRPSSLLHLLLYKVVWVLHFSWSCFHQIFWGHQSCCKNTLVYDFWLVFCFFEPFPPPRNKPIFWPFFLGGGNSPPTTSTMPPRPPPLGDCAPCIHSHVWVLGYGGLGWGCFCKNMHLFMDQYL
mmetsp:Transcript_77054/g.135913  ORF Transcript_77054/g.135913 Transcript_77054/m.135913 type:complete len:203 (-) Transcript_77054:131-739(-)